MKNQNAAGSRQSIIENKETYFEEAFSRNIGLLKRQEQEVLKNARVAIPGLGGVGGTHLVTMVRSGVGKFNIADFDVFEPANVNRQYGATLPAFGRPKIDILKEQALSINPFIEINAFSEGVTHDNIDIFLNDVDVVLDGLDFFNFEIRRLLFNRARERGIFVVTAAPLGFSSALLVFAPNSGMGFDQYFNIVKGMAEEEQYLAFAMGLAPRPTHIGYMDLNKVSFESKSGPSLDVACLACASLAGTKAIQIILNRGRIKPVPYYVQFDPYLMKFRKGKLFFGNKNPVQRLKMHFVRYLLGKHQKMHKVDAPAIPHLPSDTAYLSDDILNFLIKAGIQAPSGDNAQPWRFKKSNNAIDVYLDRASDDSFFNINQIASIISCGAVIENIKIAAMKLGIETDMRILPDGEKVDLMAQLKFSITQDKGSSGDDVLFDSIWKRNTNRRFYRPSSVSPFLIETLKATTSNIPGACLHVVTDKQEMKAIAGMIFAADQIRTQNKSLHLHLHRMIRYSGKAAEAERDGLPLKNLEAGFAGEWFLKSTRSWKVMHLLNTSGISKFVARHSYECIVRSSGVALLTVNHTDEASFLNGGRAVERAWLTLTHLGLAVQPMTAITLFRLRWMIKGKDQFPPKQRRILAQVWKDFQNIFPDVALTSHGLVMLFRFGYSKPPTTGTLRKELADLMVQTDCDDS